MYQAKSGLKNFSLYWEGGSLDKIFFSQSEHVSSQIWCQKFFPLLGGGRSLDKNFLPSLNMYQAKSGVKNFSLGGGSLDKNFFFQSEHVSSQMWCQKFFPWGGGPLTKKFFRPEHVSSQIWCQNFFPLLRPGTAPPPPPVEVWIDTQSENITFLILRMRAVITAFS